MNRHINKANAITNSKAVKLTGFSNAAIGICDISDRIIYSLTKILNVLMKEGLSKEEALEYYEYNIMSAHNEGVIIADDVVIN